MSKYRNQWFNPRSSLPEERFKPVKGKFKPRFVLMGGRRDGMNTVGGILTVGMLNMPDMIVAHTSPTCVGTGTHTNTSNL